VSVGNQAKDPRAHDILVPLREVVLCWKRRSSTGWRTKESIYWSFGQMIGWWATLLRSAGPKKHILPWLPGKRRPSYLHKLPGFQLSSWLKHQSMREVLGGTSPGHAQLRLPTATLIFVTISDAGYLNWWILKKNFLDWAVKWFSPLLSHHFTSNQSNQIRCDWNAYPEWIQGHQTLI